MCLMLLHQSAIAVVADQVRRGRLAQAAHAAWWPYASGSPTGQANTDNKAARRRCPPSLARIRAPLPRFASLSLRQGKAATHRSIAA